MSQEGFDWGPLVSGGPLFIGILNLTPDSFSDGGRYLAPEAAVAQARRLWEEGCRMLDVGAESTRPGAAPVSPAEEWARLEAPLAALREALPGCPLSLDTRHPETALRGLEAGVAVLNDVSGFRNPALLEVAQGSACGLIAMRSRFRDGALWMPPYGGGISAGFPPLADELRDLRNHLVLRGGIEPWRLMLDPGFGFGTSFEEDRSLWGMLPTLPQALPWPVRRFCLGISRKRFLAWRSGQPELPPGHRDALTAQAHQEAQAWGYQAFRTHAV